MTQDPPAMWETWVRSWVGKIPWKREQLPTPVFWPGEFHGLQSMGSQRVGHNWETFTFTFHSKVPIIGLNEEWQNHFYFNVSKCKKMESMHSQHHFIKINIHVRIYILTNVQLEPNYNKRCSIIQLCSVYIIFKLINFRTSWRVYLLPSRSLGATGTIKY